MSDEIIRVSTGHSSNIISMGYRLDALPRSGNPEPGTGTLEVEFIAGPKQVEGPVYRYYGVPAAVYGELSQSLSLGHTFDRLIKKGGFRYAKVREGRAK